MTIKTRKVKRSTREIAYGFPAPTGRETTGARPAGRAPVSLPSC